MPAAHVRGRKVVILLLTTNSELFGCIESELGELTANEL